jgi:hypothetical protein
LDVKTRRNYTAELWICDRTEEGAFTRHRRVLQDVVDSPHYGLAQLWIDNRRLAYVGSVAGVIDVGTGECIVSPMERISFSHNISGEKLLLCTAASRKADFAKLRETHGFELGYGIYELDLATRKTREILSIETIAKSYRESISRVTPLHEDVTQWHVNHFAYSSDGQRIKFCFRGGHGTLAQYPQLMMSINTDGSDFKIMPGTSLVHTGWYSNELLLSGMLVHPTWDTAKWDFAGASNLAWRSAEEIDASRFSRDTHGSILSIEGTGEPVAVIAGPANHIAKSPDGTMFAGEILGSDGISPLPYQLNLYAFGETQPALVLFRVPYREVVDIAACHPDPAFSRDGKRLYYNRPVGSNSSRMFCCPIPVEILERAAGKMVEVERVIQKFRK